ncbi:hypothetical protein C4D60_Mb11t07570 [Musa balbisiana]|uniref:Pentacotripeptide-repeat region of PRORP domain-containing protein n=1 Tax=Musa balbisiana TaxID=52838 RepID=A0A4S8J2G0_MUSBA|nr:hypothetical protein C4D60_Mb11t07570 [Musa balbisiana]
MRAIRICLPSNYSPFSLSTTKSLQLSSSFRARPCSTSHPHRIPVPISDLYARKDQKTLSHALTLSWRTNSSILGSQIHAQVIKSGFSPDTYSHNNLLTMYCKCKALDRASNLFDEMTDKNLVSWTSMISGSVNNNEHEMGLGLYIKMMRSGFIPNEFALASVLSACAIIDQIEFGFSLHCVALKIGLDANQFVGSALLWMHAKCGNIEDAELVFESIDEPDLACWNAIIEGYALNGYSDNKGLIPDQVTYISALKGCIVTGDLNYGQQVHCLIVRNEFESNTIVMNSLIDMYFRTGRKNSALNVFYHVLDKDNSSWNTVISGLAKEEDILKQMNSHTQMSWVLVRGSNIKTQRGFGKHLCVASAIIDAYAKCGDIASSKKVFENISRDCIDAILFNTMITAFAHHGLIIEAIEIFEQMKYANSYPTQATFVAVIAACSHLGLVDQGRFVFESISNVYGMSPSKDNFACLVDLFARNGLLEKAKDVIESMPFEPWPSIWISLLSGCRSYGNKEMGELTAERILKLVPDNDSAYALMANVYAADEKWKDAERMRIKMEMNRIQKTCGYNVSAVLSISPLQVLGFLWPLMSYIWTCQERSFFGLHSLLQLAKRKIEEKQSKGGTSLSIHHNWESLQACSELSQQLWCSSFSKEDLKLSVNTTKQSLTVAAGVLRVKTGPDATN